MKKVRMSVKKISLIGLSLLIFGFNISFGLTSEQIKLSKQAIIALKDKNYDEYYHLKARLKNTSIYDYLKYKEISENPKSFKQSTIDNYYSTNKNSYWISQLSNNLATYYAKHDDWQMFHKYYTGGLGLSGKCWSIEFEYKFGDKFKALDEYGKLWQNRVSTLSSCKDMENYWDKYPNKPKAYVVNKAYNLAFANKFDTSISLLKNNVKNNQEYIDYISSWKKASSDFNKLDSFIYKYHKYRYFNKIFLEIAEGLIEKNPQKYVQTWNNLKNKKYLKTQVKEKIISAIAVNFARSQSPQAQQWLSKVDKKYFDNTAWEWLLRVDLYNSDFKTYIKNYQQLPAHAQKEDAWRYWLAYSYKKTNQESKAKPIFEKLTKEPLNYYSFLSSDELGKPYNIGTYDSYKLPKSTANELLKEHNIRQAVDLYQIGQYKDSINLWRWDIRNKLKADENTEVKQLTVLAYDNNMYNPALYNIALLGSSSSMDILFPKAFLSTVSKNSDNYSIDRDLIISIVRKESMFNINAGSWAGAKGLMQITVPTADFISKKYKLNLKGSKSDSMSQKLLVPENNINIGTANLFFLDDLFDQKLVLGLAAYNAGPGNVEKWLNKKEVSAAIWIENIPFGETRYYIRSVLTYMIVYNNFIFAEKPQHITDFLNYKVSDKFSFRK